MALSNSTIPTKVSTLILDLLKEMLVYSKLYNMDYQGEITPGNILKIPSIGAVSVEDYEQYKDLTGQEVSDSSVSLLINKQKAYMIKLDDIDEAQSVPNVLAHYLTDASFALQKAIDADLAAELVSGGTLTTGMGTDTTPIEVNSVNICTQLRAMALLMDNANAPRTGRAVILPPWAVEKLVTESIVNSTDNTKIITDGMVGRYAGFDIYMSTAVPNTTSAKYRILAGYPGSATYGIAIQKSEIIRHPTQFVDIARGLCVYGAKTARPGTVVNAVWNCADEPEE